MSGLPRVVGHRPQPVVTPEQQHVAGVGPVELEAAEDVGVGGVGQGVVSGRSRLVRGPDVVDEPAGLGAVGVGAVGHHLAVAVQGGVDADHGPVLDRAPAAVLVHVDRDCGRRRGLGQCQRGHGPGAERQADQGGDQATGSAAAASTGGLGAAGPAGRSVGAAVVVGGGGGGGSGHSKSAFRQANVWMATEPAKGELAQWGMGAQGAMNRRFPAAGQRCPPGPTRLIRPALAVGWRGVSWAARSATGRGRHRSARRRRPGRGGAVATCGTPRVRLGRPDRVRWVDRPGGRPRSVRPCPCLGPDAEPPRPVSGRGGQICSVAGALTGRRARAQGRPWGDSGYRQPPGQRRASPGSGAVQPRPGQIDPYEAGWG